LHHCIWEAFAPIFLAVRLALSLRLSSFILEGDSLTVTLALQKLKRTQNWRIALIISKTLSMIPHLFTWLASYINEVQIFVFIMWQIGL
jgi:hypothetical protein